MSSSSGGAYKQTHFYVVSSHSSAPYKQQMKRRAFISSQFYIYTITGPYPYHVANAKAKDVDEVNWRYIIQRDFEEKTLKK